MSLRVRQEEDVKKILQCFASPHSLRPHNVKIVSPSTQTFIWRKQYDLLFLLGSHAATSPST